MRADITRDTFDPFYNFSRVLLQQGRVQLDADFNEQAAILLHLLRRLTADVIGPYGIPAGEATAFELGGLVSDGRPQLYAKGGRAYVGGLLVEAAEEAVFYPGRLENDRSYLVYLEVWERHVTWHETAALIREVALGDGVDTATRAQVAYRLGVFEADDGLNCGEVHGQWPRPWFDAPSLRGAMRAQTDERRADEACVVPADSRYRGLENQLYRVEIHCGGPAAEATFKWSRDNGSVIFPLDGPARCGERRVRLLHLGRDERFGLRRGDWVEILNEADAYAEEDAPRDLLQVTDVDALERTVDLSGPLVVDMAPETRPILRRWDQRASEERGLTLDGGAVRLLTDAGAADWRPLEDGIQVKFESPTYRAGDYWLIPARTATGRIEWPLDAAGKPLARPARREERYRMPLGIVKVTDNTPHLVDDGCRRRIRTLTE